VKREKRDRKANRDPTVRTVSTARRDSPVSRVKKEIREMPETE
jgi:hypothetical protein